jgi:hypothetical protein
MRARQAAGDLMRSVVSGDLPAFLLEDRADVGMLYLSEAHQLDPLLVRTVELPPHEDPHERIRFVIAGITRRGEPFVRWLCRPGAQQRLRASGFLTPLEPSRAEGEQGDRGQH